MADSRFFNHRQNQNDAINRFVIQQAAITAETLLTRHAITNATIVNLLNPALFNNIDYLLAIKNQLSVKQLELENSFNCDIADIETRKMLYDLNVPYFCDIELSAIDKNMANINQKLHHYSIQLQDLEYKSTLNKQVINAFEAYLLPLVVKHQSKGNLRL